MSHLLVLPTELLEYIIEVTFARGGFENCITSCKTIHRVGCSFIERYNNLRREWRSIRPMYRNHKCTTSLDIIEAIVRDPNIAWFIEDLNLNDALDLNYKSELDQDGEYHPWWPQFWAIQDRAIREKAMQLVRESPVIASAGQDPGFWLVAIHAVDDSGEPFAYPPVFDTHFRKLFGYRRGEDCQQHYWRLFRTVFLLTLLPNLKRLRLPSTWGDILGRDTPKKCMALLEHMVKQVRDDTANRDLPLARLQQLLPFEEVCSQPSVRSSIEVIAPFMTLQTLTDIHISNSITVNDEETLAGRVTDETGIPFMWPYGNIVSNLRSINLEGCAMNAAAATELLAHIPCITSFQYTHQEKYRGCEFDWDAEAFVAAVGKHCARTIVSLRIGPYDWFSHSASRILSLQEFRALEDLKIHVSNVGTPLSAVVPVNIKKITLEMEAEDLTEYRVMPRIFNRLDDLCNETRFRYLECLVLDIYVTNFTEMALSDFEMPVGASILFHAEGPLEAPDSQRHKSLWRVHFNINRKDEGDASGRPFEEFAEFLFSLHRM